MLARTARNGVSRTCWWEGKKAQPLGDVVWQLLNNNKKNKSEAHAHHMARQPHSRAFGQGNGNRVSTKPTHEWRVTAPNWDRPKCPSVGEWRNEPWGIRAVEDAVTGGGQLSVRTAWRELKAVMPSRRGQSEKITRVTPRTRRSGISQGLGSGGERSLGVSAREISEVTEQFCMVMVLHKSACVIKCTGLNTHRRAGGQASLGLRGTHVSCLVSTVLRSYARFHRGGDGVKAGRDLSALLDNSL